MKTKITLLVLCLFILGTQAQKPFYMSQWSDVKGYWSFDNTSNLWYDSSTYKHSLVPNGVTPTTTSGYFSGDKAITLPSAAPTNYISCIPNLASNGGGSSLNVYTIMYDIKIPSITQYYSLLQTAATPTENDGDLFIKSDGTVGLSSPGYTTSALTANQWVRIVFVCDNNTTTGVWKIFIDGTLEISKPGQGIDGHYSLGVGTNPILLFADDDGENPSLSCSAIAIWDRALSDAEVKTLGGYYVAPAVTYPIKPFLQTPTSTSIYVSWLSTQTTSTKVMYGLSNSNLNQQVNGTNESISSLTWHTVKLTSLTPNTTYYYRCISGTDSSAINSFHTAPMAATARGHIIFGLYSDIHIGADRNSVAVLTSMKQKFIDLYGTNWNEKVSCIISNGDVCQNATIAELNTFYSTYITPVSGSVPFMCTLGNHDLYTNPPSLYYQFLKYDDFSAFPADITLNEKYYSFVLGNTMFITLNSETTPTPSYETTAQSSWLETKLAVAQSDASIDFVFVNSHHPGKCEMWQTANDSWIQNTIYPILGKYSKVAMISHGHSHNYERGVIKSTNADNVDFRTLITGGGGGWLDFWADYTNETDWPQTHKSLEGSHYSIIDIDMDTKSYTATMYSLGSSSASNTAAIVADTYHGYRNQAAPNKPVALFPNGTGILLPILSASAFSGLDEIMTSQFQLTKTLGNYTSPLVDVTRDYENIFQSSGSPAYTPIDKNAGIDLTKFQTTTALTQGTTYGWRVRYRDKNLKWSAWSDEVAFVASSGGPTAPAAPSNVIATDGTVCGKSDITWNAVSNATSYKIYKDGTLLESLTGISYTDIYAPASSGITVGYAPTGCKDDFATASEYNNNGKGLFWWSVTGVYALTRDAVNKKLDIVVNQAANGYVPFGLGFGDSNGNGTGTPYTIDFTNDFTYSATIKNNSTASITVRMSPQDISGNLIDMNTSVIAPTSNAWMYQIDIVIPAATSGTLTVGTINSAGNPLSGTYAGGAYADWSTATPIISTLCDITKIKGFNFTILNSAKNASYQPLALVNANISITGFSVGVMQNSANYCVEALNAVGTSSQSCDNGYACDLTTVIEQTTNNQIHISPTITSDFIQISGHTSNSIVHIYDILGNELLEKTTENNSTIKINISNLSQGVYFISIRNNEKNFSQKIIKN